MCCGARRRHGDYINSVARSFAGRAVFPPLNSRRQCRTSGSFVQRSPKTSMRLGDSHVSKIFETEDRRGTEESERVGWIEAAAASVPPSPPSPFSPWPPGLRFEFSTQRSWGPYQTSACTAVSVVTAAASTRGASASGQWLSPTVFTAPDSWPPIPASRRRT
jgi:hypothetical protein